MTLHARIRILAFVLAAASAGAAAVPASAVPPSTRFRGELARADSVGARGRAAARGQLDSLAAAARASGDPDLEMVMAIQRAGLRALYDGAYDEAQAESRRWLPRARAARDTLLWCRALRTIGFADLMRQRYPDARRTYDEMLRLSLAARLGVQEGYARIGVSFLALQRGRTRDAERGYRIALRRLTAPADAFAARTARAGLGHALLRMGRPEDARLEYERVLAESRAAGDLRNTADALNDLGAIEFSFGDPSLAIPLYREAAALHRRVGHRAHELTSLVNVALGFASIGREAEATAFLDTIIAAAGAAGARDVAATAISRLAYHRLKAGRSAEAESLARAVVAMGDSVGVGAWADAVSTLARAQSATGRRREAIASVEAALARSRLALATRDKATLLMTLGALRTDAGEPAAAITPLREVLASTTRYRGTVGAAAMGAEFELARAFVALGRRDSALAHLRSLAELWQENRTETSDPAWREAFGGVAANFYGAYAALLLDPASGGTPARRAASAFAALQPFRARTIEDALHGGARSRPLARVSLATLQRSVLRPGEVLLDLYASPDTSFLLAVTRDSLRAVGLPGSRRLQPALVRFRDLLASESPDETLVDGAAASLGGQIFGPVADLLRESRTVLLATGRAGQYPLGLLRVPGEGEPLCARRRCAVVPSATLLASARSASAPRGSGAGALLALSRSTDGQGLRLAGVEREVRWLTRSFPAAESRENDGRRPLAEMLARLGSREVLHVASHVRGSPVAPWRAGFLLGQGDGEGAYLTAPRIASLGRPARLCVLAGCSSAGGAVGAEALPGLAAAWLSSGASAVIASLWPVGDQATADLVESFYSELALGRSAGDALGEAQRRARSKRGARLRDWAGFVVIGDPATTVRLTSKGVPGGGTAGPGATARRGPTHP